MSNKDNSSIMSLQSNMKLMFKDIMSQLGSLLLVLAKCNNKTSNNMTSTTSGKVAGCIKADDVSVREISEPSEETDMGKKPIFGVS